LEEMVESLGLRDCVTFVGHVPRHEVANYTLGFDVGYSGQVPRQMGTMWCSPLKLYEYLALGKPVIASAFADARTVIRDGVTGYLFEPQDLEGLKKAIVRAFRDRSRFDADAVRASVVEHHSWRSRVQRMIAELDTSM